LNYKPTNIQFFGSGTVRFKEQTNNANYLGPGEYNVQNALARKAKINPKAPFHSSNTRFDKEKAMLQPGPGAYNPKINIEDNVKDNKKKGYIGNFGTTDKRFKIESTMAGVTPGPGSYNQANDNDKVEDLTEAVNKGSHYFKSGTTREAMGHKKDEAPPPGAYEMKYYDLATKVIKEEEDPDLSPKKAPFNSTEARFRLLAKQPDPNEDDLVKPAGSKTLDALLKEKIKAKPSAVFASGTKRVGDKKGKEFIPGPGAYHDPNGNSQWNKRTFNILFTVD